jgi:hypothetical protein
VEVKQVGGDGGDGEDDSQDIQPKRGANRIRQAFTQTQLQEQCGESDGGDYHQGERTEEGGTAGVDHHQGKRKQKQTCRNDTPAARLRRGARIGRGIGQGVRPKLYRSEDEVFKWISESICTCIRDAVRWTDGWPSEPSISSAVFSPPASLRFLVHPLP